MPEAMPVRSRGTQAMMFFCVSPLSSPAPAPVTAIARAKGRYPPLLTAQALSKLPLPTRVSPMAIMFAGVTRPARRAPMRGKISMVTANGSMPSPAEMAVKPSPFCR
ncbi:hypothetical protein D3C76_1171120 [compost metagenome]